MGVIKELVQRADSWVNAMTGLGTLRDKLMHTQVVAGTKLQDPVLEALFNDDDVARRVVAKLPREATRRGFRIELEADPEEDETADISRSMLDQFGRLDAMPKLRDGWIWARLYGGGSGVFVGADDGLPMEEPLNEAGIRSIKFLNMVKRPQLAVHSRYEDIQAPEYGMPETYTVHQTTGVLAPQHGLVVHASRLILFDGALTARMTMESPTGFDDSVLQAAMAPLQQTAAAWQSVAHLLTDASQGVLKIANLVDLVATGGQETLRSRIQLMDLARSVCRSILIDAEKESFERVTTSFAGLPEVMDKLMMRMCAAAEQPVTLLYGRSAAGMNATGESDIRGWYDTVAEGQTDELKPRLMRLLTLMFLAKDSPTRGVVPEQWSIAFNPLWLPTDKEEADTKKVKADTYVALVGAQIMTDAEAGIGLAPDFPTIDVEAREALAEADKEEGLRPREVNAPEPEPDPEGGGGPAAKKTDSNQPRVPAGSSAGGRWTSSTGVGVPAAAAPAPAAKATGAAGDQLTQQQRQAISASFKTGKNAAVVALQQKLVARYGVPAAKAALMWERDIKAQLKAAKLAKAAAKTASKAVAPTAAVTQPTAAPSKPLSLQAGNLKELKAHTKKLAAPPPAPKPPPAVDPAAKAAAIQKTIALSAKHAAAAAKGKATKAANKAKLVAEAKALGMHVDVLKAKKKASKPTAAQTKAQKQELEALKHAKELGFDEIQMHALKTISTYGKDPKEKAAAAALLKVKTAAEAASSAKAQAWGENYYAAKQTAALKTKTGGPPPSAMATDLGKLPLSGEKLAAKAAKNNKGMQPGTDKVVLGPLKIAKSPHQAEFEKMAKTETAVFNVVRGAVGKEKAENAFVWGKSWVGRSTDKLANDARDGIEDPNHHLHAQYHATQALLRQHLPALQKAGVVDQHGYVTVFRGVKVAQGHKVEKAMEHSKDGTADLGVRFTSSWSASHSVARSFAGAKGTVVEQKIHHSHAIAVHHFEPKWGLKEIEWVLVAKNNQFKVARANEGKVDPYDLYGHY